MSNFLSIGYKVDDSSSFTSLVSEAASRAERLAADIGGCYLCDADSSGAELWVQADPEARLIGCQPFYRGSGRYRLQVCSKLEGAGTPLDGSLYGMITGATPCPLVVDFVDYWRHAARLTGGETVSMSLAAFPGEAFEMFSTPEEYYENCFAVQNDCRPLSHEGGCIPIGTFQPGGAPIDPPEAFALLAGTIQTVQRLTNGRSGIPFYGLSVSTLGGVINVPLLAEKLGAEPVVGGVLSGKFWLSGLILDPAAESLVQRDPVAGSAGGAGAAFLGKVDKDLAFHLITAPLAVFILVAGADGNFDRQESAAFAYAMQHAARSTNPLLREVAGALPQILQIEQRPLSLVADPLATLAAAGAAADQALPDSEAVEFRTALLELGHLVAQSSGGVWGFGSKVSKEERRALSETAKVLRVQVMN